MLLSLDMAPREMGKWYGYMFVGDMVTRAVKPA